MITEFAAVVGIDCADNEHAVCERIAARAGSPQRNVLPQTPATIDLWAVALHERAGGPVAVCLEQSKGALIFALMKYDFLTLYPINPSQLANYRKAMAPSGAKDDPTDADLLCDFLVHHIERLRPWRPDTVETRLIDMLARDRRELVDLRTSLSNTLISRLKVYFPQALQLISDDVHAPLSCAFLLRWSTLASLQSVSRGELEQFYRDHGSHRADVIQRRADLAAKATPLTTDSAVIDSNERMVRTLAEQLQSLTSSITKLESELSDRFAQHPDAALFRALPGAGEVLAPRLLAALGTDRERYATAEDLEKFSGVAPVVKRSGKMKLVQRRHACPKYVRQTFHEFAHHSCKMSAWAKAYYELQRSRGKAHHTAIRALAYKWIRIIHACWRNRTIYNEIAYYNCLKAKNSPLLKFMNSAPTQVG
jgi:transposase